MPASPQVSPDALPSRRVLDCTPLVAGAGLDQAAAARLAGRLRVLADPVRLRILSLLQTQPSGEACVGHVTEVVGSGQPTMSHHLRILFQAGLVQRERRGSWVYYRVVPGALDGLRAALGGDGSGSHGLTARARPAATNATFGLLLVIFGLTRSGRATAAPFAVGAYITGAYFFFTSSTSFANPAVTLARTLSDTFAGIAPASAGPFILAQLVGASVACLVVRVLWPRIEGRAQTVIVPHETAGLVA